MKNLLYVLLIIAAAAAGFLTAKVFQGPIISQLSADLEKHEKIIQLHLKMEKILWDINRLNSHYYLLEDDEKKSKVEDEYKDLKKQLQKLEKERSRLTGSKERTMIFPKPIDQSPAPPFSIKVKTPN